MFEPLRYCKQQHLLHPLKPDSLFQVLVLFADSYHSRSALWHKSFCRSFEKWVMLPVRHNFLNIYRYGNGGYSEKSIRHQFSRKINFPGWFQTAMGSLKKKECIAAFDPSYIRASSKTSSEVWLFLLLVLYSHQ